MRADAAPRGGLSKRAHAQVDFLNEQLHQQREEMARVRLLEDQVRVCVCTSRAVH